MNKEKRRLRHERNVQKDKLHKEEAWEQGKIIYENHNNTFFSSEFSIELINRLVEKIKNYLIEDEDKFLINYQKIKSKLIDSVLMYSPDIPKTPEYEFIKYSLELYWDNKNNMYKILKGCEGLFFS